MIFGYIKGMGIHNLFHWNYDFTMVIDFTYNLHLARSIYHWKGIAKKYTFQSAQTMPLSIVWALSCPGNIV